MVLNSAMRPRLVVQILSLAVIVTAGSVWMKSRATAVDLQTRLAALNVRLNTAHTLEQQRDQLRADLAEATLHRPTEAIIHSPAPAPASPTPVTSSLLPLGQWRSAREWSNEGQSTARGTVATLSWAAAGGDVAAMTSLLTFDDASRKQAQIFFDTLTPAARQSFPTPEALIASLTVAAIPNSAAQLSWYHERDADHATVGLLLRASDQSIPAAVPAVGPNENPPPMGRDDRATKLTVLSLERSPTGWRIIVPAAAIERLARLYQPAPRT